MMSQFLTVMSVDEEEEDELQEVTEDSSSVEDSSPEQSLTSSLSHSVSSFLITSEVSDGAFKPLKSDIWSAVVLFSSETVFRQMFSVALSSLSSFRTPVLEGAELLVALLWLWIWAKWKWGIDKFWGWLHLFLLGGAIVFWFSSLIRFWFRAINCGWGTGELRGGRSAGVSTLKIYFPYILMFVFFITWMEWERGEAGLKEWILD